MWYLWRLSFFVTCLVWPSLGPPVSLHMASFQPFQWPSGTPPCICTASSLSTPVCGHLACSHVILLWRTALSRILGCMHPLGHVFLCMYAQEWDCWIICWFHLSFLRDLHAVLHCGIIIFLKHILCPLLPEKDNDNSSHLLSSSWVHTTVSSTWCIYLILSFLTLWNHYYCYPHSTDLDFCDNSVKYQPCISKKEDISNKAVIVVNLGYDRIKPQGGASDYKDRAEYSLFTFVSLAVV